MTDTTPGREATAREGGAPLHFPAQNDPKCNSSGREAAWWRRNAWVAAWASCAGWFVLVLRAIL